MHSCFYVSEIIFCILSFLQGEPRNLEPEDVVDNPYDECDWQRFHLLHNFIDRRSVARVARTCKLFHEPAISILWEYQSSLAPLIRVMPRDLWVRQRDYYEHDVTSFSRPISGTDWERFNLYNSKIHYLKLLGPTGVAEDVLIALAAYRPAKCLLPQLRSLTLSCSEFKTELRLLTILLGESVQTIRFWGKLNNNGQFVAQILESAARCCPNVTDIQLSANVWLASAISPSAFSIPGILTQHQNLRTLSIYLDRTNADIFRTIGTLESLRSLTMTMYNYPSPTTLAVTGLTWRQAISLLKQFPIFSIHNSRLEALTIRNIKDEDFREILKIVPDSVRKLTGHLAFGPAYFKGLTPPTPKFLQLTSLCLDYNSCSFEIAVNELEENLSALDDLLDLRHLRDVDIAGVPSLALHDDWISAISTAWPHLRSLYIAQKIDEDASLTLEGLIPLAQNARHLTELSIGRIVCEPFDLTQIDDFDDSDEGTVSNVQEFTFTFDEMEEPMDVMYCIYALFPKAVYINGLFLPTEEDSETAVEWLPEIKGAFEEMFPYQRRAGITWGGGFYSF